jgi:hypothetical protein
MRLHSFLGRLALPVALLGLTTIVGAAAPAHAAEPDDNWPLIDILVPERVVTVDGRSKAVPVEIFNLGGETAKGIVVEYGADSPIDPSIGFTPPPGCGPTSCKINDLAPGARKVLTFTVKPTAALPDLGASFDVGVAVGGPDGKMVASVTVVRATAGADLEVAPIADIKLAPGKSAPVPVEVRNNGNKPVETVALGFVGEPYVSFPAKYSNCQTVEDLLGVVCFFEQTIGPDEILTIDPSTPLTVKAAADAPGPADYYAGMFAFGADDDLDLAAATAKKAALQKSGTKLALVPLRQSLAEDIDESELNDWDNIASFVVKVSKNPADLVAIGDNFTGAIGDTRTIKVGFRNDGPAATIWPQQNSYLSTKVRIPSGLTLTEVDDSCVPAGDGEPSWGQEGQVSGHDYLCVALGSYAKGEKVLYSFTAKINDGENEDEGTVTVNGGVQDPKTSNNVAKIEVKVSSAGGGGGLPVTGAPAGLLAGGGALLLVGGAVAFVLARRRRIVTIAE